MMIRPHLSLALDILDAVVRPNISSPIKAAQGKMLVAPARGHAQGFDMGHCNRTELAMTMLGDRILLSVGEGWNIQQGYTM
jgi:hypothetical protein